MEILRKIAAADPDAKIILNARNIGQMRCFAGPMVTLSKLSDMAPSAASAVWRPRAVVRRSKGAATIALSASHRVRQQKSVYKINHKRERIDWIKANSEGIGEQLRSGKVKDQRVDTLPGVSVKLP